MKIYQLEPQYDVKASLEIDSSLESQRSYHLFKVAISSPVTFKVYDKNLKRFMKWSKVKDYDTLASFQTKDVQKLLKDYLVFNLSKKSDLKKRTILGYFAPIELFLDVNEVVYNKRAVHLLFPKDVEKQGNEKTYTNDDIRRMLKSTTKLRSIAIIHFFASTGARPAVIVDPILRFRHVRAMPYGCKAILLYEGSREEYWAFLTPEASRALDDYRDWRISKGETISENSPLFLNSGIKKKYDIHNLQPLSIPSLNHIIKNLIRRASIERIKTGSRFDKGQFLGFRKRFNTILKINSEVNFNIAEKLMAHKRGLDGVYFKPTLEDCFKEFVKAIPELTTSEENKLKIEIREIENSREKLILEYENRLKATEKILSEILHRLPND